MDELLRKPAREVVRLLGRREVGPVELIRRRWSGSLRSTRW